MTPEEAESPEVLKLAALLNIRRYHAVGIIECVRIFTREYCPRGMTGKYSNRDIALWIEWPEERAHELVEALVESGWLRRIEGPGRLFFVDYNGRITNKRRRQMRMRLAGGEIGRRVRRMIFSRDGHRCLRCGATCDLTIDHRVPVAAGGTNAIDNLQTLCRPCNSSKRDRIEDQQ